MGTAERWYRMENGNFFENGSQAAGLALGLLDAEGKAFVRLDPSGRIIALTPRAEQILRQLPLRDIGETLSGETARALRRAAAEGVPISLREMIDDEAYRLELRPGAGECLLYLAPEREETVLTIDQLADRRLRNALSSVAVCEGEEKQQAVRKIYRMLNQVELLRGAEGLPRKPEPGDLSDVCRRAAASVSLRRPDFCLTLDCPPAPAVFVERELRVAVCQLLTNAILAPDVTEAALRCGRGDGMVWVEAADNGAPLSQAQFETLCAGCWQAADPRAFERRGPSPGLGLPVLCRIARLHDGTLTLRDEGAGWKAVRLSFPDDLPAPRRLRMHSTLFESGFDLEDIELSVL